MVPGKILTSKEREAKRLIEQFLVPAFKGMRKKLPEEVVISIYVSASEEEKYFEFMTDLRYCIGKKDDRYKPYGDKDQYNEPDSYDYASGTDWSVWMEVIKILQNEKSKYNISMDYEPDEECPIHVLHFYQEFM